MTVKNTGRTVILNTELVRAISENGQINLFIRMANGQWAVQRPYDADLRGQIGALTLAIDALAGKIILQDTVQLDERDFAPQTKQTVDVAGTPKLLVQSDKLGIFGKKI